MILYQRCLECRRVLSAEQAVYGHDCDPAAGDDVPISVEIPLTEDRHLVVNFTVEGIIIDLFDDLDMQGTVGMTFDEWADFTKGRIKQQGKEDQHG